MVVSFHCGASQQCVGCTVYQGTCHGLLLLQAVAAAHHLFGQIDKAVKALFVGQACSEGVPLRSEQLSKWYIATLQFCPPAQSTHSQHTGNHVHQNYTQM